MFRFLLGVIVGLSVGLLALGSLWEAIEEELVLAPEETPEVENEVV